MWLGGGELGRIEGDGWGMQAPAPGGGRGARSVLVSTVTTSSEWPLSSPRWPLCFSLHLHQCSFLFEGLVDIFRRAQLALEPGRPHPCLSPFPHSGCPFWLCNLPPPPSTAGSSTLPCVCVCARAPVLSLTLGAPWTVAHQAPPFMGFPRQEYWSGLQFPPPGDLPDPRIKPQSPASSALAGRYFTTEPPGKSLPKLCPPLGIPSSASAWQETCPPLRSHPSPESLSPCLRAQGTLPLIYLFPMGSGLIHKCLINVC